MEIHNFIKILVYSKFDRENSGEIVDKVSLSMLMQFTAVWFLVKLVLEILFRIIDWFIAG